MIKITILKGWSAEMWVANRRKVRKYYARGWKIDGIRGVPYIRYTIATTK